MPGVGEKTATKLIADYGNLEGVYDHLDELTPRLRQNLAEHREQVFLNRKLMTLVRDLELDLDLDSASARGVGSRSVAKEIFESLEFYSLWEDLLEVQPAAGVLPSAGGLDNRDPVWSPTRPRSRGSAQSGRLVLDLIDSGCGGGDLHRRGQASGGSPRRLRATCETLLADAALPKMAHDGKDLIRSLLAAGYDLDGLDFDTALASYLINPATREYDLASIASRYLQLELDSLDRPKPTASRERSTSRTGPISTRPVAGSKQSPGSPTSLDGELDARDELELFRRFELPLVPVLARMEHDGIGVDRRVSRRDGLRSPQPAVRTGAPHP